MGKERRMFISLFVVAVGLGADAGEGLSQLPQAGAGMEWRLVWNDEFNGAALDEGKWERMDCPRREAFWGKDDAYLDGNGCLVLRTRKDGDRYSSGAVRTKGKFGHRYGYWECRCKFHKQQGHWPAFWMMPVDNLQDADAGGAAGAEIDVMEKAWLSEKIDHALHWNGYGSHQKSEAVEIDWPGLNEGFHSFGVWWSPEEYVFYIDGKESWRAKGGGPSQAVSYMKLTEEIGPWAGKIEEAALPDYFLVDYARVYDLVPTAEAAVPEALRGARRVVFLGDSITQAGDYVTDVDCWFIARGIKVETLNLGLGSETATDLTEAENASHKTNFGFGRPAVSERLERALAATRPDVLVVCYGMNDGGSLSSDESGLERFATAVTKLREAALKSGVRKVAICTPPVRDAKGDEALKAHEANLARYSDWIMSKKVEGWDVVDIHGPMRKALDEGRAKDPNFALAGDGVHPGREGHWIMANAIISQFFGGNLDGISSSEQLFGKNGNEIRGLARKRMDILFGAWMSKIGHGRPGVAGGPDAAPGISVDDATAQSAKIAKQIADLVANTTETAVAK
jgi:beta-glucanase (GH16 family)